MAQSSRAAFPLEIRRTDNFIERPSRCLQDGLPHRGKTKVHVEIWKRLQQPNELYVKVLRKTIRCAISTIDHRHHMHAIGGKDS